MDLEQYVPEEWQELEDLKVELPRLAKDKKATGPGALLASALANLPTSHELRLGNAKWELRNLENESVHLVLTSPPYWNLKPYEGSEGQFAQLEHYEEFLNALDAVWEDCYDLLVPGGRLVCVVGDVCLPRRSNGRHVVMPLHSSIQERARGLGFDNLSPIFWQKITNVSREAGGGGFLGTPYEPGAVLKNDVEYILLMRKPGGYRHPSRAARLLSVIRQEEYDSWFRQVWEGPRGAKSPNHPAAYPVELAIRLIRMFSYAGDTVLDPFMGSATTNVAAGLWGRNSIGVELEPKYFTNAYNRLTGALRLQAPGTTISTHGWGRQ